MSCCSRWTYYNLTFRSATTGGPVGPPCGPARYAITFGPLNVGESNLITAVTVGGPDGCISVAGSPLASMTGPLSGSQVAASFAAQTGIPGTVFGPTFVIDAGVTALCCALQEDDLVIAFNGTLRFTPDFDCCPPAPPSPPAPFEPVELVSDWVNVSSVGLQSSVVTVTHPDPAFYFLPLRRGVIKRYTPFSGTAAIVSLGTAATSATSLLGPINITNTLGAGRTASQNNLLLLPSGTGIDLFVSQGASTAPSPFVKVIIRGIWLPVSVC